VPAAAIGPAIGGVTSLLGGILGSGAAGAASSKLAGTMGRNSEQLAEVAGQQLKPELAAVSPYIQGGQQATNTLAGLLRTPGQGLLQGYGSFQAPTGVNYQNDPGYQFRLQQGVNALQNSAAARGDLLSGNTLQSLTQLGQGLGSEEYGNVFNRALQAYQSNASNFYQNQANQFGRLSGMAGMGLQGAGMAQNARENYANLYGNAMGMSNAGAGAAAQGIMGQNAAWENALGGMANAGMGYSTLSQLGNMMNPQYQVDLSQAPLGSPSGTLQGMNPATLWGTGPTQMPAQPTWAQLTQSGYSRGF
jgi:hypothetical protein